MGESGEEKRKSFGNISEHHWSRARAGLNEEALDYYRKRSHDPGVAEGGAERNFWCMDCGGVIPYEHAEPACPHCGAALAGDSKRYFNWVEIDRPVQSDLRAVWPVIAALAVLGVALVALVVWLLL